ncbi:GNAT family N-acetyltransferase [Paenibacillus piscarius]|uniref:GNAT family N-acetyltransferase n=1 Tax=Paenibacillus piscarius TaxID=1089681 RepID=UPI001EE8624E|nr:GNAT family protein [Paenibacillus piscarius]
MLHSDLINLRPTTLEDLDFVLSAEGHELNRRFVGQWSREQHAAALTDKDIIHLIVEGPAGGSEGYVILTGIQDPDLTINIRRLVIQTKGRGYGTLTLKLLIHWAFAHTDTHRLWLDVKDHNVRAQRLYANTGFKLEGTLRECLRTEEGFESIQIMSILRHEYIRMNSSPTC